MGVQLSFLLFDLPSQLLNQLVILEDQPLFLTLILLQTLPLALVKLVQSFCLAAILIRFVLSLREFVL